jgi:hypothetical protein
MTDHGHHHKHDPHGHGHGRPDDRRSHNRFPVIKDLAEPVDILLMDGPAKELPAVLTNLSAGGMSLMVFAHVSGDTRLKIVLDVPGLEGLELLGHVRWTSMKGDTTTVGVQFNHLAAETVKRINHMAEAYQDCELKISFGLKDVCFHECSYWPLCHKTVKLKR